MSTVKNKTLTIGNFHVSLDRLLWSLEVWKKESTVEIESAAKEFMQGEFQQSKVIKFTSSVCTWGRIQRIYPNIIRGNNGEFPSEVLTAALRTAYHSSRDDIAIEAVESITGFGISSASKHLRFIDPNRFAVLDSRYNETLGFSLNPAGYSFFLKELRLLALNLRKMKPKQFGSLTLADIENVLFFSVQPDSRKKYA